MALHQPIWLKAPGTLVALSGQAFYEAAGAALTMLPRTTVGAVLVGGIAVLLPVPGLAAALAGAGSRLLLQVQLGIWILKLLLLWHAALLWAAGPWRLLSAESGRPLVPVIQGRPALRTNAQTFRNDRDFGMAVPSGKRRVAGFRRLSYDDLTAMYRPGWGHYSIRGNAAIADRLYERLMALPEVAARLAGRR